MYLLSYFYHRTYILHCKQDSNSHEIIFMSLNVIMTSPSSVSPVFFIVDIPKGPVILSM